MSNPNAPFGFRPVKSLAGAAEVTVNYYTIASSASRIGKGDLVKFSSGNLVRESGSAASGPWLGVSLADSGVIAAGGVSAHPVCDDPNAIFQVQGSTSAITTSAFGTIVKANCKNAPDSNYGLSQDVLTNTTATAQNGVRIIRLANTPGNAIGANAVLEVKLNADIYNGNLS